MDTVICDWGLKMAGVKEAEHKYFYAVVAADDGQRRVPRRGLPVGASVLGAPSLGVSAAVLHEADRPVVIVPAASA